MMQSPRSVDARVAERAQRLDVAGQRALHVRDAEAVEAPVRDETLGLEARHALEPGLAARVRRVHVPVEHQARAAAGARADPEHVGAAVLDLLPLHLQPDPRTSSRMSSAMACSSPVKLGTSISGSPSRRAGRGRSRVSGAAISAEVREHLLAEEPDLLGRSSPQSSSMMCVQPASRYSSIAAMQSLGRAGDRLALVEDRVGHVGLGGQPAALLHRLGDGTDLVRSMFASRAARRPSPGCSAPCWPGTCRRSRVRRRGRARGRSRGSRRRSCSRGRRRPGRGRPCPRLPPCSRACSPRTRAS